MTANHSVRFLRLCKQRFCTYLAIATAKQFIHVLRLCQQNILYVSCDCASKIFCTFPAIVPAKYFVRFLRLCQQNICVFLVIMPAKQFVNISYDCDSRTFCIRIQRLCQQKHLHAFPAIVKAKTFCVHILRL